MLLKYVVTTMVDDSFIFSVMYSNLSFLAQPSNNARLLKDDLLNGEPIPSCQTKYNDMMIIMMMMSMNLTTIMLRFNIITARTQIPMLKQVRKPVRVPCLPYS